MSTLRFYGNSNPKNWNFDKYTIAHVAQHNILHSLHTDYGVDPVSKIMKINYYQDGILDLLYNTCDSFQR